MVPLFHMWACPKGLLGETGLVSILDESRKPPAAKPSVSSHGKLSITDGMGGHSGMTEATWRGLTGLSSLSPS